jgi:mRNA-degrading endonuclease HigB of HigAB toxin-antitoxin module
MRAVASIVTLVREQFPAAKPNLQPWRDDAQTRQWDEPESLDLSFHFPGGVRAFSAAACFYNFVFRTMKAMRLRNYSVC